jgi:IPT/TIG domain-containing protein/FG-GAP repeat protein
LQNAEADPSCNGRGDQRFMMERMALAADAVTPWRRATLVALLAMAAVLLGGVLVRGLPIGDSSRAAAVGRSAAASGQRLSILPAAAQAPVSTALGTADPEYRVSASAGGFEAVSPQQRLRVRFEGSSVQLDSGAARLALRLDGLGYGSSPQATGDVLSHVAGNRVTYVGDGLSGWYANGPLGLEQGFTVASAPAGPASGPLTLSLALSGNVHAALAPGGASVLLNGGGSSLRYGDLAVTDAHGRTLHSWLGLRDGQILLRVDARDARYPLRVDPLLQQAKLTAGAEASGEGRFAASVAMSADGDTALIGAPGDDGGVGAAWVFTRSGATWTQQGPKLTGGEAAAVAGECEVEEQSEEEAGECGFGKSVALSGDGDTALVGGPGANGNLGAVWVFVRSDSTWTQQGPALTGGDERTKGHFGRSVALSSDGSTALIGAPGDSGYTGAAWVFTRAGASWSERAKLSAAGEGSVIDFGLSVALSGDGATALIGAPGAADRLGAAWVFADGEASGWVQQAKLVASDESGEGRFGYSVALSADAGTALVGGRPQDATGAAWAFTREDEAWSEPQALTAGGEADDESRFGYSVALSADGSSALVGDPGYERGAGAVWLFTRSGSAFGSGEALTAAGEHGSGRLGASVAFAGSGESAILGAPSESARTGAAWAFVVPGAPPAVTGVSPGEGPTSGGTKVTISGSGFNEATGVEFGSVAAQSFEVSEGGTSITATSPKEAAGRVNVTVDSPGFTSATSESDLFTFVAPAKKGGHREEPEPGSPSGGSESEPPVSVQSTPNGPSGSETIVAGSVLAFGPTAGPACAVSLLGRRAKVRKRARAALKLSWKGATGAVVCRGKLTLAVRVKLKGAHAKRYKTVVIGTASFSISPGKTKLITVRLNAAGRSRLRAANRRGLAARLTILVSTPGPRRALTHAIRLVLQRVAQPRQSATLS